MFNHSRIPPRNLEVQFYREIIKNYAYVDQGGREIRENRTKMFEIRAFTTCGRGGRQPPSWACFEAVFFVRILRSFKMASGCRNRCYNVISEASVRACDWPKRAPPARFAPIGLAPSAPGVLNLPHSASELSRFAARVYRLSLILSCRLLSRSTAFPCPNG